MMVYISIVELLPTALKYDPEDRVVSSSVLCGMAAMAASLLMFAA
jgi:zinc transporter ZupT